MHHRFDPRWLESQYDNRARVANFADHLANWAKASQLVRRDSPARLDLPYGPAAGETLDVFEPTVTTGEPAPVLVFVHGGYWRALDKSDFSFVAPAFNAAGASVVVLNYALCPAVSIEDICVQLARAVLWVHAQAPSWGGDPSRISLVGHSAGGHLAAMLLCCRWKLLDEQAPVQPLAGALSISGLFDLEPLRHTPSLQADLKLTPASVARLSPAFFPRPKGTKLYTTVGLDESDEFLRQNHLIRDVWGPTAVPVCETIPGANHFSVLTQLVDPQARLHRLALRQLGLHA